MAEAARRGAGEEREAEPGGAGLLGRLARGPRASAAAETNCERRESKRGGDAGTVGVGPPPPPLPAAAATAAMAVATAPPSGVR